MFNAYVSKHKYYTYIYRGSDTNRLNRVYVNIYRGSDANRLNRVDALGLLIFAGIRGVGITRHVQDPSFQ